MPADPVQRRLAADVAGYSGLIGVGEEDTLASPTAHLADLAEFSNAEPPKLVAQTTAG